MKHFIKATLLLLALLLLAMVSCSGNQSVPNSDSTFEVNGIIYNKINSNEVEVTFKGTSDSQFSNDYSGSVTIPATVTYHGTTYSVTSIGYAAFEYCTSLTAINIPNSVTNICSVAFRGCSTLTSINIPNSVTNIFNSAFNGCSSLENISVASNNTNYDSRNNCNAIIETATNTLIAGCKNTTIPNSVTSIGDVAFGGSGLTTISIPNSVTSIGSSAFSGCSSLTSINIPNSVTTIAFQAFDGTAWYDNQPDGWVYAGLVAYEYKGTKPEGTSITLRDGTTGIADGAFSGCSNLTTINIPNSVTYIGEGAFSYCIHLNDVYCYATTPPKCCPSTFTNIISMTNSATLHVPAASLAAYLAAPVWKDLKNIVGDAVAPTGIATSRDSVETRPGE